MVYRRSVNGATQPSPYRYARRLAVCYERRFLLREIFGTRESAVPSGSAVARASDYLELPAAPAAPVPQVAAF
jgi:hypothetical protein